MVSFFFATYMTGGFKALFLSYFKNKVFVLK